MKIKLNDINIGKLFDLSNRVIVLTGAAGLLGRKYAHGFCQAGANVVLCDIDYIKCEKLKGELEKKYDVKILAIRVDITDENSVKNMTKKILSEFSRVDVLVNNAVFPESKKERSIPFEEFPISLLNRITAVNVNGMILCCQHIGKIMKKQKFGVIINVSSIYGLVAADQRIYGDSGLNSTVAYAITKSAILNLTRYLASYWSGTGIRVNSISIGGVESGQDSEFIKRYSNKTMLGRMAKTDEYVGSMLYLASDASAYMTGSNLVVDGGWTAW
jgi:NAD(P)-dependent dehydrogenase (short-subunit alcohol dehydrogenase family)